MGGEVGENPNYVNSRIPKWNLCIFFKVKIQRSNNTHQVELSDQI